MKLLLSFFLLLIPLITHADGMCKGGYKAGESCTKTSECNFLGLCAYGILAAPFIKSGTSTDQSCKDGDECIEKEKLRCYGGPKDGEECDGSIDDCKKSGTFNYCFNNDEPCFVPKNNSEECNGERCVDGSSVTCQALSQGVCQHLGKCIDLKTGKELLIYLSLFKASFEKNSVHLEWITETEKESAGFRIWRGVINEKGELINLTVFGKELASIEIGDTSEIKACDLDLECIKNKLGNVNVLKQGMEIQSEGSEREGAHYSYFDTSANHKEWTYYYLLEDLDTNGNRAFHWDFLKKAN